MSKTDTHKIIARYVKSFLETDSKEYISNPDEKISLGTVSYISRKSLKYITHSRQNDHYDADKICSMIIRCEEVIRNPELYTPNHNNRYSESKISGRLFENDEALLVVHITDGEKERVFNAFYRSRTKYLKMFK